MADQTTKKIRLADNTILECLAIKGGHGHTPGAAELIQNAYRDVLTIEFDPSSISVEALTNIFKDSAKTATISILDENNEVTTVYEKYSLYVTAANKAQTIYPDVGVFAEPQLTYVNFVKMGQITHVEYLLKEILAGR